jgi:hypothetical protein
LLECSVVNQEEREMLERILVVILVLAPVGAGACAGERPRAAVATLQVITIPGRPGEKCMILVGANHAPLAWRCSYDRLSS